MPLPGNSLRIVDSDNPHNLLTGKNDFARAKIIMAREPTGT